MNTINGSKKIILDLCGGTGSWSKPYKDAGYEVHVITLPKYDVRDFQLLKGDKIYGVLAAPPCTEFSIVKNRKIKRDLDGAMEIVKACLRIIEEAKPKFFAVENPVGLLKNYLGKSQYSFHPWYFGDAWTKHTMLWGNFSKPKRSFQKWEDVPKIEGLYVRPGRKRPSMACLHKSHKKLIRCLDPFEVETDAEFRGITSPAFAKAFFKENQ